MYYAFLPDAHIKVWLFIRDDGLAIEWYAISPNFAAYLIYFPIGGVKSLYGLIPYFRNFQTLHQPLNVHIRWTTKPRAQKGNDRVSSDTRGTLVLTTSIWNRTNLNFFDIRLNTLVSMIGQVETRCRSEIHPLRPLCHFPITVIIHPRWWLPL